MKTNVVKLQFVRNGQPTGREYTYYTNTEVAVGDLVEVPGGNNGIITQINVPEEEIAPFKDRAKTILGKVQAAPPAEFHATQTHCGQYKRYGDLFRVWDIQTECQDKAKVLEYCFSELYKRKIPESSEYHANIRIDGEKSGDANYYFAGYYTLEKTNTGYKFTVCEPYAD